MRPLRNFAARPSACAIVTGQCYVKLSRAFYISSHAQEISRTDVTPLAALARAGRLSYDPSQDPIAVATTAGAGDCDRAGGAVPDLRAAATLQAGDGERPRGRGAGAGRDQFQPPSRR